MPNPTPATIHVQPPPKKRLEELLNNPPKQMWDASHLVILWLDAVKREVKKM